MREIGSEFWEVPICSKMNTLFPESTQWFLSGRSALKAIIKKIADCHTVAIPSWCCDSMIKPFIEAGYEVEFYPVYYQNGLIQEINTSVDVLFLIDYFGYKAKKTDYSSYKGIVIRDLTHSLFSSNTEDADYYFGSLRKWCGVWTGGYAWTKDGQTLTPEAECPEYIALRQQAMSMKQDYILGKTTDKKYLQIFEDAENMLETTEITASCESDILLAKQLDIEYLKKRRKTNAEVLISALQDWLIFPDLSESNCPMFVPVLVPDNKRNDLRGYLIKHKIYCPVHWPVSDYHRLNEREKRLYDHELSLVCDQRYDEQDMGRIIDTIHCFSGG